MERVHVPQVLGTLPAEQRRQDGLLPVGEARDGLSHFGGVDFLLIIPSLMVVGIGLALIYEHRQSVLASMAAHATFNLVGYVFIVLGRR